ncbi:RsmE family RNA methyltransferase [Brytella acorum]|uniref:Ribosomal RNA small subunit methyltransferase E n=1 Tax=Brytella acorum TaxID=2959299 RepID=A0AA35XWB5_9PROT|nr:RsmE family RNA methyltransferase [Brytella acorum]MDF3624168.1 RsmE family RNA methyltransferase [Brytella acorum]CAI9120674.1 RsmE family RNA methyltransferase [Brytella acorum]
MSRAAAGVNRSGFFPAGQHLAGECDMAVLMQDSPRIYIDFSEAAPFFPEREIALGADHARYLGTVLRLGPDASVRIFNAVDGEWEAVLLGIRKDRGSLRLVARCRAPVISRGPVLLFAPLKRDATDLVIRMGTEMGVSCFVPVTTVRTNTHRINPERLRAIAIEAAEQCERLDVPGISALQPLMAAVEDWPENKPLFAALERHEAALPGPLSTPYGLLVGPEGGFAPEEKRWLSAHDRICPLSLGPLVLRADTAVCAGLARLALSVECSISTEF